MILKGSQRGGGLQLARHLLKTEDNEHVEVHELRGFLSSDLEGAFREAHAVSKGTRARQFLFSLSLNPPATERVSVEEFEAAIEQVERKLGFEGQPRAVVFHEKDGRRHAHAVWSRIDTERMRAINLPHFKLKLRDVSRELYLEHGWKMPRGLANSKERDPATFDRGEWEQAKRGGQDAKALKLMFRECWLISDSKAAFANALKARGYTLARGDRRGHVVVDFRGEVYAIAKWIDLKAKDVRARLGDGKDLPSVEQAKSEHAQRMTAMLRRHTEDAQRGFDKQKAALAFKRAEIVERQRKERAELEHRQQLRWAKETAERAGRLTKGVRGLWDRLTGARGRAEKRNEAEAWACLQRDRAEKDALIVRHLDERQAFHQQVRAARLAHAQDMAQLHRDIAGFTQAHEQSQEQSPDRSELRGAFHEAARPGRAGFGREGATDGREGRGGRRGGEGRERDRGFGPDI
jgi:hypothetical protein